jgi:hypothetical protein
MKRVNPLHIIALLSVLILFLFSQIITLKSEIKEAKDEIKERRRIATELLAYKRVYGDKEHNKRALKKILQQPSFQKAGISFKEQRGSFYISAKSFTLRPLNSLLTKIFNGPYEVKSLDIKRKDEQHAQLQMEVAW